MAWYDITYSCGHTTRKQLYGPNKERESYIAWAAKYGQCEDCRHADAAKCLEAIEAEHGLPALTGSDKQIAWARTIRSDKITEIAKMIGGTRPATLTDDQAAEFDRQAAAVMQTLYGKETARWWIDNREQTPRAMAQAAYKEART